MWRNNLLYSVCVFTLLAACSKEDTRLKPTEVVNWLEVKDKPGELGHLLYNIYEKSNLSILVNDTLGYMEGESMDANGNLKRDYETVSEKYLVYSANSKIRFVLSADTAAMLKAAKTIEKWVVPNLPSVERYRTRSFLLVDSLLWDDYGGDTIYRKEISGTAWVYNEALETVPAGKLANIKKMDERTLKFWSGMLLAPKVLSWLKDNCADSLAVFYDISGITGYEGWNPPTLYNLNRNFNMELEYSDYSIYREIESGELISLLGDEFNYLEFCNYWEMGFLEWTNPEWEEVTPAEDDYYNDWYGGSSDNKPAMKIHRKVPSQAIDAMNYIAVVYAFSDAEFDMMFAPVKDECEKCFRKRVYMKELVRLFEEANGVMRHPFN